MQKLKAAGNANSLMQQAADFVTDSNGEDGFAKAIGHLILGDNRSNEQVRVAQVGRRA